MREQRNKTGIERGSRKGGGGEGERITRGEEKKEGVKGISREGGREEVRSQATGDKCQTKKKGGGKAGTEGRRSG